MGKKLINLEMWSMLKVNILYYAITKARRTRHLRYSRNLHTIIGSNTVSAVKTQECILTHCIERVKHLFIIIRCYVHSKVSLSV